MAGSGRQRGPLPVEWGFGPTLKDDASDEPIAIRGARVHNLKGLDCDIPRNRLVVITGLRDPARAASRSTPSTRRDSAATSSASRPTRANSSSRWTAPRSSR